MLRIRITLGLLLIGSLAAGEVAAQRPSPVMEYSSVLTGLDVFHARGTLQLHNDDALTAVFLPRGGRVEAVVTQAGSSQPLHVQKFYTTHQTPVFSRLETRGLHEEFTFPGPGDYVLTYRTNGQVMSVIPFEVVTVENDDEFDPQTFWYVRGPWSHWAYLYSPLKDGPDGQIEFRIWAQKVSFEEGRNAELYDVKLMKDGDVIGVTSTGYCSSQEWMKLEFQMRHPDSKGGRAFKLKELLARDGQYHFVVEKQGQPYGVWALEVAGGKPQLHAKQNKRFEPRTEYIVPRFSGLSRGGDLQGNTVWMERISDQDARAVASRGPAEVQGPTQQQRDAWTWLPRSIDPQRPFEVVVTDIETRADTNLAVGEDLIVFATGFPTGVKYYRVGESKPREIPDGETFDSRVFHVCGTKIVLVKKNRVAIFDTRTERMVWIPEDEVFLYDVVGGMHRRNLINTDGFLVGTINKVSEVSDRTILKVIDISADTPRVIPIKNAEYVDSDVSCVALDAEAGIVAVASRQQKLIAAAKIAPLANQHVFDVSDYRGVERHQIFVDGEQIIYADSDWNVRLMKLGEPPRPITDQRFGPSSNGFFYRNGQLAVATTEKYGTRYHFALSDLSASPRTLPRTGDPIEGTSGGLGMAGCAAIAVDKTVFLAGTPSGGVGVGEHLQMLSPNRDAWIPVRDGEGNVISAIDVTTSMGLLAFKAGGRGRNTTIGYATYGQRIEPHGATATAAAVPANTARPTDPGQPAATQYATLQLEQDNTHFTHDEEIEAVLSGYLENETTIANALSQAFGAEVGKQRALETALNALRQSGMEHLVDEYLRRSTLVPDDQRPAAQAGPATRQDPVDPRAVQNALKGEWSALRFVAEGEDLPDEALETLKLTLANGQYVLAQGGRIETGTYEIDTSRSPFWITIQVGSGPNRGQIRQGAFKLLEEDRLMMTFSTEERERSTRFVSSQQDKTLLAVYRRSR